MTDHTPRITEFFAAWGVSYDVARAAQVDLFGEDGEWIAGPGIPATRGGEAAAALFDAFRAGYDMDTVKVDLLKIGQTGDVVWTERVDHMMNSAGEETLTIPVVGVMTMNPDGTVRTWTDYWDMREFDKLVPIGSTD